MEFHPTSFFGLGGLVKATCNYLNLENENWGQVETDSSKPVSRTPRELALRELAIRTSSAVAAYFAIPVFAILGGGCQLLLLAYTGWTGIMLPLLRGTQSSNPDENRFLQPIQQCSEHLLQLSLNIFIYIFRRCTALAFLFPSSLISTHNKIEKTYIPVLAQFLAYTVLGKDQLEKDQLEGDKAKVKAMVCEVWNVISNVNNKHIVEQVIRSTSFLFAERPDPDTSQARQ